MHAITVKINHKVNKHTACGFSLFPHCSFDSNKNKHDYYRDKDHMKNFCKDHGIKIIVQREKDTINRRKKKTTS